MGETVQTVIRFTWACDNCRESVTFRRDNGPDGWYFFKVEDSQRHAPSDVGGLFCPECSLIALQGLRSVPAVKATDD